MLQMSEKLTKLRIWEDPGRYFEGLLDFELYLGKPDGIGRLVIGR